MTTSFLVILILNQLNQLFKICQIYGCKNLIKGSTCFKNPEKPSFIDFIITNRTKLFENFVILETELSDFHKMTLTVMNVF